MRSRLTLLLLAVISYSTFACGRSSSSHQKDFIGTPDSWTMIRRVNSPQDSLTTYVGQGAAVEGQFISRKGAGWVVFGPYYNVPDLAYFGLSAAVKMKLTYEGEQECSSRGRDFLECTFKGCPQKTWDCSAPAGAVRIDLIMKDQNGNVVELGHRDLSVSKDQKIIEGNFSVDNGNAHAENADIRDLEIRVNIINEWMRAEVEETTIAAQLMRK